MEEKTPEELARIAEKRKEQGKKLQEMAAEKRREKVCFTQFSEMIVLIWHRSSSKKKMICAICST